MRCQEPEVQLRAVRRSTLLFEDEVDDTRAGDGFAILRGGRKGPLFGRYHSAVGEEIDQPFAVLEWGGAGHPASAIDGHPDIDGLGRSDAWADSFGNLRRH